MLSLNIPPWKLFGWLKGQSYGQLLIGIFITTAQSSCITSHAEFFGKTSNCPGDSATLQPRCGALWLLAFPKAKITFETEEIQTNIEIQENMMGQLMVIGRTVWGPKVPALKGMKVSLSHVQCFLYLVSSSINVSIFYIACWILSLQVWYTIQHVTV